jgi:hypothetical protein
MDSCLSKSNGGAVHVPDEDGAFAGRAGGIYAVIYRVLATIRQHPSHADVCQSDNRLANQKRDSLAVDDKRNTPGTERRIAAEILMIYLYLHVSKPY